MKSILLLHGWGYRSYSSIATHSTPWYNKQAFIDELKKDYKVYTPFFPGFCGEAEPNNFFDLDDYARYIENFITVNNLRIDIILGNSFGGEVAVRYKTLIDPEMPIVLVVPAILRKSQHSQKFVNTPKLVKPLRDFLRNLYVTHIKKTPEMKYGTRFLRNSYQKIVRYNLIAETKALDANEVLVLLGKSDSMVDTSTIYSELTKTNRKNIFIIDGGHEIIETHRDELLFCLIRFVSSCIETKKR